jgi:hypothetical protein
MWLRDCISGKEVGSKFWWAARQAAKSPDARRSLATVPASDWMSSGWFSMLRKIGTSSPGAPDTPRPRHCASASSSLNPRRK